MNRAGGDGRAAPASRLESLVPVAPLAVLVILPFAVATSLASPMTAEGALFRVGAFASLGLLAIARATAPTPSLRVDPPLLLALLLGLAIALSAARARPSALASPEALLSLAGIAFYLALRETFARRDLLPAVSAILLVQLLLLSLCGFLQRLGFEPVAYSEGAAKSAVVATFGQPNFFASFLAPALFVVLPRLLRPGSRLLRGLAAAAIVAALAAVVLARARGAALGIAAGGATTAGILFLAPAAGERRRIVRRLAFVVVSLVVAAGLAAPLLRSPAGRRVLAPLDPGTGVESRVVYWFLAARMARPTELVGLGNHGFDRRFPEELDALRTEPDGRLFLRNLASMAGRDGRTLNPGHVHDDPLQLLVEAGPLALAAWLGLVSWSLLLAIARCFAPDAGGRARGDPRRIAPLVGGLVATLVDGLTGFPLLLPASLALTWFLVAALEHSVRGTEVDA